MIKISMLIVFLLTLINSIKAEQTLTQISASENSIYYGVPLELTVVEHGTPTDYYVSVLNSGTWTSISNTFGWGESSPFKIISWTPSELLTSAKFGIHTGSRNSGTFTSLPTDESDFSFDVQTSSMTLTLIEDNIWFEDLFNFTYTGNLSTLPSRIRFQYKESSSLTWTTLDTLNTSGAGIALFNNIISEDVNFRLTYLGTESEFTLAETGNITFLSPSMTITNKEELENSIFDDVQNYTVYFETERISEYTKIIVKVASEQGDLGTYTLEHNVTSISLWTPETITSSTTLTFETSYGAFLGEVIINSKNKIFELRPINNIYQIGSTIEFDWTVTNSFDYTRVEVIKNSGTFSTILNQTWDLNKKYSYEVLKSDTTLQFTFVVDDGVTQLTRTTEKIKIENFCRDEDLLTKIEELNSTIDSLELVIWELETAPEDTIYVVLIKDPSLDVEDEYIVDLKVTETLPVIGGRISLPVFSEYVYFVDVTGSVVSQYNMIQEVPVSHLSAGLYILSSVNSHEVRFYKFIIQ